MVDCNPMDRDQAPLASTISQNLLKFMSIELVMLSSYFILCFPLLLLPSIFTIIRVFSNELAVCIRWPKYWIFSFSINPSNKHSGFISFKIDWFDLLAVQGTLKHTLSWILFPPISDPQEPPGALNSTMWEWSAHTGWRPLTQILSAAVFQEKEPWW